jgi:hypothetical protein
MLALTTTNCWCASQTTASIVKRGGHEQKSPGKVSPGKRGRRLSKARLDEPVEEALVDAYGESEQATGFYTMIENHL